MKHKYLGIGVGVRRSHFDDLLNDPDLPDWFEIITENFLTIGGKPHMVLDSLAKKRTIVPHGLSLSLASSESPNIEYLNLLKSFVQKYNCPWFSDHLCISGAHSANYHDLIPPLRTEEALSINAKKINDIKLFIGFPFAIENISHYAESTYNTIPETEFINRLTEMTDSFILLDINNVYVNALNYGFDPRGYLSEINLNRVIQIHLAGHFQGEDLVIDTHGDYICEEVWKLFEWYLQRVGRPISTLIEWDHSIPEYSELKKEYYKAKSIVQSIFGECVEA